ncbi:hypothetical protein RZ532_03715 [Nitratireductor aquimarinus]|uniref:hypothetical protein n=1 Tax=Nitratireductor aquimarinus TaxID=889300 RepID=UPI002935CCFB|nr:hypothetical protein [Nitratireductor aquimarinus]MDV2965066.1 hypothetical protein [Nitratireductor aquimarinus]
MQPPAILLSNPRSFFGPFHNALYAREAKSRSLRDICSNPEIGVFFQSLDEADGYMRPAQTRAKPGIQGQSILPQSLLA